jgi:hypothetical protein
MEVAEVDIQATPIRSSQCVLFEVLQSINNLFLETGDGGTEVDWIEVERQSEFGSNHPSVN